MKCRFYQLFLLFLLPFFFFAFLPAVQTDHTVTESAVYAAELTVPIVTQSAGETENAAGTQSGSTGTYFCGLQGDELIGRLAGNGTFSVSGEGMMADYPEAGTPWKDVQSQITYVNLDQGVRSIGQNAFNHCENLTSVHFPESLTGIGAGAFAHCTSLEQAIIPQGVTAISERAFHACSALNTVTIPDSVQSIGVNAFAECTGLVHIQYEGSAKEWDAVQIADGNQSLSAVIQFTRNDPQTVTPVPTVTQAGQSTMEETTVTDGQAQQTQSTEKTVTVSDLSFSFANTVGAFAYPENYRISLDRYKQFYGDNRLAQKLFADDFESWHGNSFGMSVMSSLLFHGENGTAPQAFQSDAPGIGALALSDRNPAWNLTLQECIEMLQVSYKSPAASTAIRENLNRYQALQSGVTAFQNGGNEPLVILLLNETCGHALVGYRISENVSGRNRLYVYDPDFPGQDNHFITFSGLDSSENISWTYEGSGQLWESSQGSQISFLTCQTCVSLWNTRNIPHSESNFLTVRAADFTVLDSADKLLARVENGFVTEGEICQIWNMDTGTSSADTRLWVPSTEVYIVTLAEGKSLPNLETSCTNIHQSVSVRTRARSCALAAEDKVVLCYTRILEPDCDYLVEILCDIFPQYRSVSVQGVTPQNDFLSINEVAGSLNISGPGENARLYINGETKPVSSYSMVVVAEPSPVSFTDVVNGSYYYDAVLWAIEKNITNGTSSTTFSPGDPCSRANILTFLWRAYGCPESVIGNPFTDVKQGLYYAKAAVWAYEHGLISGTQMNPLDPCTRAEAIFYLWKLAGSPDAPDHGFQDVSPDSLYRTAVNWAAQTQVTLGTTAELFSPDRGCTRGQIMTFLYRYFVKQI